MQRSKVISETGFFDKFQPMWKTVERDFFQKMKKHGMKVSSIFQIIEQFFIFVHIFFNSRKSRKMYPIKIIFVGI